MKHNNPEAVMPNTKQTSSLHAGRIGLFGLQYHTYRYIGRKFKFIPLIFIYKTIYTHTHRASSGMHQKISLKKKKN